MAPRATFFVPPDVTALDLAGPLQVFQLANDEISPPYQIEVCGLTRSVSAGNNLRFANLVPYQRIVPGADDILFVCGWTGAPTRTLQILHEHPPLFEWIRNAWRAGATICSICTGAFLLAEAGILDGCPCATHWMDIDDLQKRYPRIEVRKGILFAEAGRVFTSAGIASGIDLAIHLISLRHGPKVAFAVARRLVVYLRRSGDSEQDSVYLKYRNHLDDVVHRAQDILIEHLDAPPRLSHLAEQVGASPRNLSRRFRQSLGLSMGEYRNELRLERARSLLQEQGSKVESVARACGFTGSRQLRNLYRERFGHSPRGKAAAR